ncbi:hypothetical protein [Marinagarivorans algicola]|uniref:hypothetical protein n=1 Tax=Marinagarivorans algicola TaxID=1513270 RepID=UPI0006B8BF52|nr:hypothetical protein [Marinagarivorans algicola]
MKGLYLGALFFMSAYSFGDIVRVTTNNDSIQSKVTALRVESHWGFVSFDNNIGNRDCPKNRVYLNLKSEVHRVAYSTAMAAYMAGKVVEIRADNRIPKVFSACSLYDIVVAQ